MKESSSSSSIRLGGAVISDRVVAALLEELRTGRYADADRLPAEVDLAAELGVSRTVIRDALSEMERAGYVERRPDPADARGVLVCLTDRGKALAPVMDGVSRALEALVASRLSAEEADALERLLSRCVGE